MTVSKSVRGTFWVL